MTALPTELLFTVLERLNGEKVALSIISLTGRTLLTHSRAILFQSVCLHPANTSSFIELLTSPYTTLPPAVRQLSLLQRLDPDISETSVSDDADGPEWLDKSIDVLARLRCVDVLQIDRIEWCQLAPATRTTLTTSFSGITRFRLSAVAMDTLDDLIALVCAFPHLETLALDDIGWDVPDASPSHQFPVGLRRLHLGSLYKRDLLEWMRARSPVPLVKHLSLGAVSPADAQEIGEYVAVANSQLQSLRVAFNSLDAGGDAEDFSKAVDLSRCAALRSLWIDELVYFALFRLTSPFPWLVDILLQAAVLPELERITLTLYIDAAEQLDASEKPAHWAALDAVFAPPNFANLVALDVLICGEAALPPTDVALRAKLPTCASRGLLRVIACDAAGIWD